MQSLTITRGLPASGKSTWALEQVAKYPDTIRVNRDSIREMLGVKWSPKVEKLVMHIRDGAIRDALASGRNVICDDTNLSDKTVEHLRAIAAEGGYAFRVNDSFMLVDVETCIARDALRPNGVGKDVILKMYHQNDAPPPAHIATLDDAIICDLDGTLCLFEGNPYHRNFSKDTLNKAVATVLDALSTRGCQIIFLSGRGEVYRAVTEMWLNENGFYTKDDWDNQFLFMRAERDNRADHLVKHDLYVDNIRGKYNVLFVLDDRPKVVRRWRHDFGLTVLQVAPDIDF